MLEVLHETQFKMAGVLYGLKVFETYEGNGEIATVKYGASAKRDSMDISITVTFTYPCTPEAVSFMEKRLLFRQTTRNLLDPTSAERVALCPYDFCNTGILFEKLKVELELCFASAIEMETFRKRNRYAKRMENEEGCRCGTRCQ